MILVYPFDWYEDVIGIDTFIDSPSGIGWGDVADGSTKSISNIGVSCRHRVSSDCDVHRLTFIRGEAARLEQGVYLNDTIIDFYMQW